MLHFIRYYCEYVNYRQKLLTICYDFNVKIKELYVLENLPLFFVVTPNFHENVRNWIRITITYNFKDNKKACLKMIISITLIFNFKRTFLKFVLFKRDTFLTQKP